MSTFLMIHGAWHGGWCFDSLRASLEAAGHTLLAPDLPGMGTGDATLDQWTEFTVQQAQSCGEPVILCGHSRGGIVISSAAEQAPESIRSLIYIAAFMLPTGTSFMDYVNSQPRLEEFQAGLSLSPDSRCLMIDPQVARAIFYPRSPADRAEAACQRLCPEPLAPALVKLSISEARYGQVERHYIECLHDLALPIIQQRAFQLQQPCRSLTTLDSDHSPFACCPEELERALLRIAERVS